MKRVVSLILVAVLLLSFASCGKKPKVEETVSEEVVVSEPEVVSTESVAPVSSQPAKKKTQKQPRNPLKYDSSIVSIALFGLDTRDPKAFSGRADSMMILSLDQNRHTVKLVSVVRDSLVPIPGHGYGKINAAYAYGGADLAVKTLNHVFKMKISDYASVNFFGMAEIIDAMGGVDVELTAKEVQTPKQNPYCMNSTIGEICGILGKKPQNYYITKSGKQHLNGIQAVGYCRVRKVPNIWGSNGDYGRTERQRYVMEQLCKKVCTMDTAQYPQLITTLLKHVKTSLSVGKITTLATTVLSQKPTLQKGNIPYLGRDMRMSAPTSKYGSVEYYDIDFAADLLYEFFNNDVSFKDYIAKNGVRKNNWLSKGIY